MRSIVFGGVNFSEFSSAEVVERVALPADVTTMAVPGRAGAWSSLFEDGGGTVDFMLLDPVAYGMERSEVGTSFEVGGTWPAWPAFELVAAAGPAVQVGCGSDFVSAYHRARRAWRQTRPLLQEPGHGDQDSVTGPHRRA